LLAGAVGVLGEDDSNLELQAGWPDGSLSVLAVITS
jgi:hypothetical protein